MTVILVLSIPVLFGIALGIADYAKAVMASDVCEDWL
jgi:hypothetical protein